MQIPRKALAALMIVLAAPGCGVWVKSDVPKESEEEKPKRKEVIVPVEAMTPIRGDISAYFETFTRIQAKRQVEVTSEGVGKCLKVHAEEGDRVKRGQVLAELDKDEAEASYRQSQVNLKQQEVACKRAKEAFELGVGPEESYDTAKFNLANAKASLETQRVQLENLTIRAPIGGFVTMRAIQVGMLVSSGTPVFKIVDPSSFELIINPPEGDLPRLKVGQVAKFSVDSVSDEEFEARISRINPSVDATTGTVKVTLSIDQETQKKLRESAFARVNLVVETHKDALLLPKDAIVEENARKFVFTAVEKEAEPEQDAEEADADGAEKAEDAGGAEAADADAADPGTDDQSEESETKEDSGPRLVAKRVEVTTGIEDSMRTEIVSGIEEDALVITLGQLTLKDGTRIKVTTAEEELAKTAGRSAEEALQIAEEARAKDGGKKQGGGRR